MLAKSNTGQYARSFTWDTFSASRRTKYGQRKQYGRSTYNDALIQSYMNTGRYYTIMR
jgi:hypothetical protein